MMKRWLDRLRWRRSRRFEDAVSLALEELQLEHGDTALDQARRKARRRDQPTRRKWVWKAVVRRLESKPAQQTDT